MAESLIVVLGAPNEADGRLSALAQARGQYAAKRYQQLKAYGPVKVLCTGGFGEHFNVSTQPHGELQKQHMQQLGVAESDFLTVISSRFTFEDASLSLQPIKSLNIPRFEVVTSGFHLIRVRFIFDNLFVDHCITYHGAPSPVSIQEYARLLAHEKAVMPRERENVRSYFRA